MGHDLNGKDATAQDGGATRAEVSAQIAALPPHRRPPIHELGRRSQAAELWFRAMRPDEGGRNGASRRPRGGKPPRSR